MYALKFLAFSAAALFAAVQAAPNCPPGVTVTATETITITIGGPKPTGKPPSHPSSSSTPAKPTGPSSSHPGPTGKPPGKPTITITTGPTPTGISQCNTGPVQCCNSVEKASSKNASKMLGLLGIVLQDLNVPVGLSCIPINVLGIGGNSCSAQPVCCQNNTYNGLINIGCSPINI